MKIFHGAFGGEKYTKAAYQDAEKKILDSGTEVDEFRNKRNKEEGAEWSSSDREINNLLLNQAVEAIERKMKLYKKGQAEGNALNDKYDRLLAQAQESLKAVEDFEKEELGISRETVH